MVINLIQIKNDYKNDKLPFPLSLFVPLHIFKVKIIYLNMKKHSIILELFSTTWF
jgi:hypothetical protein